MSVSWTTSSAASRHRKSDFDVGQQSSLEPAINSSAASAHGRERIWSIRIASLDMIGEIIETSCQTH